MFPFSNGTFKKVVLSSSLLAVAGCSTMTPKVPEDIKYQAPTNMPKPVITNFNEAVACMDNLMLMKKVAPIYVSSEGLINYTADRGISSGGKEMLITTLSQMSIRSNAVRFVSYGSDMTSMLSLQGAHPNHADFRVPDFFIRGGVTQHNKTLWSGQTGAGASYELSRPKVLDLGTFFSLHGQEDLTSSYSMDAAYGTVTVDMSAGYIATLQNIPGVASANTLALENRKGKSVTGDISISDLGLTFSLSDNKSHDFNTLFRSLIQVGSIEIIGKLQKVPYWRCLANAGAVESRDNELLQAFITMQKTDEAKLNKEIQKTLAKLRYYRGQIDGLVEEQTQTALQEYQKQMGLLASGTVNYETFRMMQLFTPTEKDPTSYWWQGYDNIPPQARTVAAVKAAEAAAKQKSTATAAKKSHD